MCLYAGRTDAVGDCISAVRDAFESMDSDEQGEIPAKDVKDLFRRAQIATVSFEHTMTAFAARMNKQVRHAPSQHSPRRSAITTLSFLHLRS